MASGTSSPDLRLPASYMGSLSKKKRRELSRILRAQTSEASEPTTPNTPPVTSASAHVRSGSAAFWSTGRATSLGIDQPTPSRESEQRAASPQDNFLLQAQSSEDAATSPKTTHGHPSVPTRRCRRSSPCPQQAQDNERAGVTDSPASRNKLESDALPLAHDDEIESPPRRLTNAMILWVLHAQNRKLRGGFTSESSEQASELRRPVITTPPNRITRSLMIDGNLSSEDGSEEPYQQPLPDLSPPKRTSPGPKTDDTGNHNRPLLPIDANGTLLGDAGLSGTWVSSALSGSDAHSQAQYSIIEEHANNNGDQTGAGPATFRSNANIPLQQNAQARNSQISSGRIQNGKLGTGSSWGASGVLGAPGLLQSRNTGNVNSMSTFDRSMGMQQGLDADQFPSLGGGGGAGQSAQQQNVGSGPWAPRPSQQSQLSQQQSESQQSQPGPRPGQQQNSGDDFYSSVGQFAGAQDEGRSQASRTSLPQTQSADDFPPLRNTTSDSEGDRRGSLAQNTGFGAYTNGMSFSSMNQQQRNPLSHNTSLNRSQEQSRITSPSVTGAASSSRSPLDHGQNGTIGQARQGVIGASGQGSNGPPGIDVQRSARQTDYSNQIFQPQNRSGQQATFGNDMVESPAAAQQSEQKPLSQMSEADRFGFAGFLSMYNSPSEDVRSLVRGQDMTSLGLDINSPEPLYPNFSTPFTPSGPLRPIETDYTLPECYKVGNVTPLMDRITGFTDETLFYIFYTMPRDIMQVLVAEELEGRKWRYHKVEKMWLTRDESFAQPAEVEVNVSEAGWYLWWDWKNWKRVRRQYVLRYEDLDEGTNRGRTGVNGNAIGMGGAPSLGAGLGNGFGSMASQGVGGFPGLGRA